jgi:Fe-S cluster biosynthesis and repair protein YggX
MALARRRPGKRLLHHSDRGAGGPDSSAIGVAQRQKKSPAPRDPPALTDLPQVAPIRWPWRGAGRVKDCCIIRTVACSAYQQRLQEQEITCSISRTGNCYDNAAMESFWNTLKTELVYHEKFATREAAKKAIFEYVEVFYNRERKHSSIGYVSPESFETALN